MPVPPNDDRSPPTRELLIGEALFVYCFDFSNEPGVIAGQTLSLPDVDIVNGAALVTLGAPAVSVADFDVLDEETGEVTDTVAAGKAVLVAVSPGSAKGYCTVTATALLSGGARRGRSVTFRVRN